MAQFRLLSLNKSGLDCKSYLKGLVVLILAQGQNNPGVKETVSDSGGNLKPLLYKMEPI
jgi:hypothetical protein